MVGFKMISKQLVAAGKLCVLIRLLATLPPMTTGGRATFRAKTTYCRVLRKGEQKKRKRSQEENKGEEITHCTLLRCFPVYHTLGTSPCVTWCSQQGREAHGWSLQHITNEEVQTAGELLYFSMCNAYLFAQITEGK